MMAPRALKRLGWPGMLGALMLASAAWVAAEWLPRERVAIDDLGSQARRLRYELREKTAVAHGDNDVTRLRNPQAAWQALWQGLPDAQRRAALPSRVLSLADRQGLRIASVQYRGAVETWSAMQGQILWRQRMVMPIEGSYPALRHWLGELLEEPALAIDAIDIQRDDAQRDVVKGRVSLSLYWRQGGGLQP